MKLFVKCIAVLMMSLLFLAGCGPSEEVKKAEAGRDKILMEAATSGRSLQQGVQRLKNDNEKLKEQLHILQAALAAQDNALDEFSSEVRDLQKVVGQTSNEINAERRAREARAWKWYHWILLCIMIGCIAIAAMWLMNRPKPFDEEDDDDFENFDDDLNFDDDKTDDAAGEAPPKTD